MLVVSQMCSAVVTIAKCFRQKFYRKPVDFLVNSLSLCDVGFVFNYFRCTVNRKSCIEDIIIANVLRWVQFRELRRACNCTGAKVWVSQRLKSLRRIRVRNCGFSKSDFFVVCEDIWIAICPFLLQWIWLWFFLIYIYNAFILKYTHFFERKFIQKKIIFKWS